VVDPHQAVLIAQESRARGVVVHEFAFTATSVGRLALSLHQAIRNHRIALPDDEALLDELAGVRLRKNTLGVYRLDHDAGQHDDQAIALALGTHHLLDAAGTGAEQWIAWANGGLRKPAAPASCKSWSPGPHGARDSRPRRRRPSVPGRPPPAGNWSTTAASYPRGSRASSARRGARAAPTWSRSGPVSARRGRMGALATTAPPWPS